MVPIIPGFGNHVEWFVVTNCCPIAPGEEPPEDYCEWDWHFTELSEAMDAALEHVAEVHTPKPPADIAELVGLADYSKPRVSGYGPNWFVDLECCVDRRVSFFVDRRGTGLPPFTMVDTWAEAMDAAHAHVREHHALTSANHTPTWEPCGRGICAANAGHEGTCEEASGFYDWTPEFYDDDLDAWEHLDVDNLLADLNAHRDAMDAGQSARITVTYTRDDPDPSTEAWRELLATSREDA